ncbi:MAG: hypothetical protein Q8O67_05285 [Deltaproteobacteria bacterium]|nr:hypothetical protein [Deltaproteobacteria bacterium]
MTKSFAAGAAPKALIAALALLACACSTPLASRRAQVLEKGEVEFLVVPAAIAAVDLKSGSAAPLANLEGSVRFGILEHVDAQLRVDQFITPEVSAGWQLIGDPKLNEFAVTVTGGAKFGLLPVSDSFGEFHPNISVPLQILVDIPIGEEAAIYGGSRTILGARFDGADGSAVAVTPGFVLGVSVPFGAFKLQPEIAANVPIQTAGSPLYGAGLAFFVVGIGVGGQFDIAALKPPKPAEPAPTPTTPAPDPLDK